MKPFLLAAVVLTLLLLSAALVRAYDQAPLFWQNQVESEGVVVKRLHDAEAGVNCYVASAEGRVSGASGGFAYRIDGSTKNVSISCVKIR